MHNGEKARNPFKDFIIIKSKTKLMNIYYL